MANTPSLVRTIAPASEPLTLTEVKDYLRVSDNNDDTLITNLIETAREAAERFLRSSLINQSWKTSYDEYTPSKVRLAMGPAQSITSVTVFARDETPTVISSDTYYLSAGNINLMFDANVVSHRIEITYVTGYGSAASNVPEPIRQGMLAHIAAIYDGRAGKNAVPSQALALYSPYKTLTL